MTEDREVVEDHTRIRLSLRRHSVALLHEDLRRQGMVACADLAHLRDGRSIAVPGIVLMR